MAYKFHILIILMLVLIVFGCSRFNGKTTQISFKKGGETSNKSINIEKTRSATIRLATTTSLDNSGLLNYIIPDFKNKTGISVDVIAVGSGQALKQARDGNIDVVIVHSPDDEESFINEGWGLEKRYICQSQYLIAGPKTDPANLVNESFASEAFKRIAETKLKFISRGDNSGTHKTEIKIWQEAGIKPSRDWYIEAGQGMSAVLSMASEMGAYTLTDTATFFSMQDKLQLSIILAGDPALQNIYSVILLNPQKLRNVKHAEAMKFAEWITSSETKKLISEYEVNGHKVFEVRDLKSLDNTPQQCKNDNP